MLFEQMLFEQMLFEQMLLEQTYFIVKNVIGTFAQMPLKQMYLNKCQ
jgi:hypothetical protein